MRRSVYLRAFAIFLISAGLFSILIPWSGFSDPDAFYHATISSELWSQGPLRTFSALDRTLLGTHFADLHLGFHLIVVPFTAIFGILQGLRIASVLLAALCVTVFYGCVRALHIRSPEIWVGLLLATSPFVFRASLGKATPLAVSWLLLGITVAWSRHPWLVAVTTMLYALSHGGWIYLSGSILLLLLGDVLVRHLVYEQSWKQSMRETLWREAMASWGGVIVGILLHPNVTNYLRFSWAQVVTIGLQTPLHRVSLGLEWHPLDVRMLISFFAPVLMVLLVGGFGLMVAPRIPVSREHGTAAIALGIVVAVLVALSLKSQRNVEMLSPILVLWTAVLWSLVDSSRFRILLVEILRLHANRRKWGIVIASGLLFGVVVVFQLGELWSRAHPPRYSDSTYRQSMQTISLQAQPGDRVFHIAWDEFPLLYAADSRLNYVYGLDPTFLALADPHLSEQMTTLLREPSAASADDLWRLITQELGSKFVFVSKRNRPDFFRLIKGDSRYEWIGESEDSVAFRVRSP